MKTFKISAQDGVSVVELFIVLIILGIVVTLAVVQFRGSSIDLERQAIVREFKVYLERARFDSVRRRAEGGTEATITLYSPTSFTARIDLDGNGSVEPHEDRVVDFTQKSNTRILVTDALNWPVTISFDRRGHATTLDASNSTVDPVFTICSHCERADPDQTVISLSSTGTVAVTREAPDPSSLPDPTTTNPPAVLNCYVYVHQSNTNTNPCPIH